MQCCKLCKLCPNAGPQVHKDRPDLLQKEQAPFSQPGKRRRKKAETSLH